MPPARVKCCSPRTCETCAPSKLWNASSSLDAVCDLRWRISVQKWRSSGFAFAAGRVLKMAASRCALTPNPMHICVAVRRGIASVGMHTSSPIAASAPSAIGAGRCPAPKIAATRLASAPRVARPSEKKASTSRGSSSRVSPSAFAASPIASRTASTAASSRSFSARHVARARASPLGRLSSASAGSRPACWTMPTSSHIAEMMAQSRPLSLVATALFVAYASAIAPSVFARGRPGPRRVCVGATVAGVGGGGAGATAAAGCTVTTTSSRVAPPVGIPSEWSSSSSW